jgi:hypothetical protein
MRCERMPWARAGEVNMSGMQNDRLLCERTRPEAESEPVQHDLVWSFYLEQKIDHIARDPRRKHLLFLMPNDQREPSSRR